MQTFHDHKADRIVAHQPGHIVGWVLVAAAVLVAPACFWALTITTSGGVAIVIGAAFLAAVLLLFGAMALTAITATFDGTSRSLTIRRDRPWRSTVDSVPFADVRGVTASRHWWLDATEYRFEIALAGDRTVKVRCKPEDEPAVQDAAVAINRFIRR